MVQNLSAAWLSPNIIFLKVLQNMGVLEMPPNITFLKVLQNMSVLGMFNRGGHSHPGLQAEAPLHVSKYIKCFSCCSCSNSTVVTSVTVS